MENSKWLPGVILLAAVACQPARKHPDLVTSNSPGLTSVPADSQDADAGTQQPPSVDAGSANVDAGTPVSGTCDAPGLVVCDDFEAGTVGSPPAAETWGSDIFQNIGSLAIDSSVAHSGTKSVHVNASMLGGYGYVMFTTRKPFPAPNNSFYTRFYLRSKNGMGDGHSTYFAALTNDGVRALRLGFNHFMMDANLTTPNGEFELQSGDWNTPQNGVQFQPGQWYCVEAFYNGATPNELRVWVDGNEIQRLHGTDWNAGLTNWMPPFDVARFGFETYHGVQDELWYDDVAIGEQRIGCTP